MKVCDNEMPDEFIWAEIFSPELVFASFNINVETEFVVEFGCGTGSLLSYDFSFRSIFTSLYQGLGGSVVDQVAGARFFL